MAKQAETAKELAFALFDQGKRPSDPEVKALGIKPRSTYTYYQRWKKKTSGNGSGTTTKDRSSSGIEVGKITITPVLADAQELRFVPRVYTTDYSPIIRAAQDAAVEFWGWPKDMTLGDFLDTALHFLFMEHGITLAGYTITEEAREALEKAREAQGTLEIKEPQEVE